MSILLILGVFLPVGLSLLIVGWRGSSVGDDPHCRKCGFNLRGRDPSSPRCPECGTELTDRAIRIGRFERKIGMVWIGGVLTLLSFIAIGVGVWAVLQDANWAQWKPTSWLLSDIETTTGQDYANALAELQRRIALPSTSQTRVDAIIDSSLAHQADRTTKWNSAWADLIAAAGQSNRLSEDRAKKYFQNGLTVTLTAKPKARRDSYLSVELQMKFDRLATNAQLRCGYGSDGWKIDATTINKYGIDARNVQNYGGSSSYGTSVYLHGKELDGIKDGAHQLNMVVDGTFEQTAPFRVAPIKLTIPLTTPVQLFPKGAMLDDFVADPEQREAERAAITGARVTHDPKGLVDVRVKLKPLTVAMSMQVILKQGDAEQKVGGLRIDAGGAQRWYAPFTNERPKFTGKVDIHLKPDQGPADGDRTLKTYWGEEIVIPGVIVDAPYDTPFNKDESLRPAVVKAIQIPKIKRAAQAKQLSVNISFVNSPVKLAYKEILQLNGQEVVINPYGGCISPGANEGYGTSCDDVDPAHKATECDVIFRPDPEWEKSSNDLTPPWGGEVVLHHVKIETPATQRAQ